jgi:hypothetical protein
MPVAALALVLGANPGSAINPVMLRATLRSLWSSFLLDPIAWLLDRDDMAGDPWSEPGTGFAHPTRVKEF